MSATFELNLSQNKDSPEQSSCCFLGVSSVACKYLLFVVIDVHTFLIVELEAVKFLTSAEIRRNLYIIKNLINL